MAVMTRRFRGLAAGLVGGLVSALLIGCSVPPPDAWLLLAIRHDTRLDGDVIPQPTDVTFPMTLTSDTAGGFWGHSAGSWLHLDADGGTVRRFNLVDDRAPRELHGLAALTPERLVVSAGADGAAGALHVFDTTSGSWEVIHRDTSLLGDVATRGNDIYVVAYATDEGVFTVRRIEPAAPGGAVDVTGRLPWPTPLTPALHGTVAIAVGPDDTVYVATQAERIVVDADGGIRDRAPAEVVSPDVAVGPDGTAVWTSGSTTLPVAPTRVIVASDEARAVIAATGCDDGRLVVGPGTGDTVLEAPCAARGLAWVGPGILVAAVGGESGAVLVRAEAPGD